jgi:hypothetical protein
MVNVHVTPEPSRADSLNVRSRIKSSDTPSMPAMSVVKDAVTAAMLSKTSAQKRPPNVKDTASAVLEPVVLEPVVLEPVVLAPEVLAPELLALVVLAPEVLAPEVLALVVLALVVLEPVLELTSATQSVLAVEPFLSVFLLPGQGVQTAAPMSALKVSAGHLTAASPSTL